MANRDHYLYAIKCSNDSLVDVATLETVIPRRSLFRAEVRLFGIDVTKGQLTASVPGVLAQEAAFLLMELPWYLQRFAKVVWSNGFLTATYKCVKSSRSGCSPKVNRVVERVY